MQNVHDQTVLEQSLKKHLQHIWPDSHVSFFEYYLEFFFSCEEVETSIFSYS